MAEDAEKWSIEFCVDPVVLAKRILMQGGAEYALSNYARLLFELKNSGYSFAEVLGFESKEQSGPWGLLCNDRDTAPFYDYFSARFFSVDIEEKDARRAIDHDVVKLTLSGGAELFARREELGVRTTTAYERKSLYGYLPEHARERLVIKKAEGSAVQLPPGGNRKRVLSLLIERIREIGLKKLESIDPYRTSIDGLLLSVWLDDEELVEEYVQKIGNQNRALGALEIAWRNKSEKCARAILRWFGKINKGVGHFCDSTLSMPNFGDFDRDCYLVDWNSGDDKVDLVSKESGFTRCSLKTVLNLKFSYYDSSVYPGMHRASIILGRFVENGAAAQIKEAFNV
jgi:hypothetical protein